MEQPTTFRNVWLERATRVEERRCVLCGAAVVVSPAGTVPLLGETTVTRIDWVRGECFADDWVTQFLGPLCPACAAEEG